MIELPRGESDIHALSIPMGPDARYAPIDFRPWVARVAAGMISKFSCIRYPSQVSRPRPSAMNPARL